MRSRQFFALLLAASLSFALTACGPSPDPVDAAVDGASADAGRDARAPLDADDEDASEPDAGEDAAVDPDAGDAAADLDGSVDGGADAWVPECATGEDCDDGDACTVDTCESGLCAAAAIDPDDSDVCTVDSCDPVTGVAHVAVDTDDADLCTADACDATTGVSHTPIADCCETTADCTSGVCSANVCQPASCTDGVLNDDETDVDCGGADCLPCELAEDCSVDGDCESDACVGGVCVECATAAACPGTDTECRTRTCSANVCGFSFTASGTVATSQTAGDCRESRCDGAGNVMASVHDTDLPVDGNACTQDVCTAGTPSNPPAPASTACSVGGAVCDGAGACVACVVASDCPGSDTECRTRTCLSNACGVSFAPAGTPTAAQLPGDCQQNQCNGAGAIVAAASDTDLPVDASQCTADVCTAGVPSNAPLAAGTACTQGGGTQCNGAGACVQCVAATDCPGSDTECQTRTCNAGVCGVAFTAAGTPVAAQTAGDCQQRQCDGAGAITSAASDTDLPVDASQCTSDVCTAGVPSNPPVAVGSACDQNGGTTCDDSGVCVGCVTPSSCPGSDTECQTRTCSAGVCGFSFTAAGTPTSAQTAGDCQQNQCDGAGAIVSAASNGDVPADDTNQCTSDVCVSGAPAHPPVTAGSACSQNGGSVCSAGGSCVECVAASDCPGMDTECATRTCSAGVCGMAFVAAGTPTAAQLPGDCQQNQCNGVGAIVSAANNGDVPADDLNQCTDEVCVSGVPASLPLAGGEVCNQNGGVQCDGAGSCVQCVAASDCPGSDTECSVRTCNAGMCGRANAAQGTPVSAQTTGDCRENQCDGSGNVESVALDIDLPADTNQCTSDVCMSGVPAFPPSPAGTACSQSGGTECDGSGACVTPTVPPAVASTTPADGSSVLASASVAVTFTTAMSPATLTGQTTAGACSGSIQVSLDDFATCVAFASATATMSSGNTVATLTPAPGLLVNRTYKIRVTTAAQSAAGIALASQFTQAMGFATGSPGGPVVIAQVYGGGGNAGATYTHDYVVLHNRGTGSVSLAGWSVQYAGATGTGAWTPIPLSGTVVAGGYYLVQLGTNGAIGSPLPTPDASGGTNISASNGKLALVRSTSPQNGTCPSGPNLVDFIGFGTANCDEGAAAAPAGSNTLEITRTSCADANDNSLDFATGAPTPRNTASPASICPVVLNESNAALEADYCNVQFPTSLTVGAGMASETVYGRVFETGVTEAAGAAAAVRAQVGYGPATSNPQYQAGWSWTNATYNTQVGNDDEYQASFTAPAAGTYRYAYRVSLDSGASWTICDLNGAGANGGLTFDLASLPVLTVTP